MGAVATEQEHLCLTVLWEEDKDQFFQITVQVRELFFITCSVLFGTTTSYNGTDARIFEIILETET